MGTALGQAGNDNFQAALESYRDVFGAGRTASYPEPASAFLDCWRYRYVKRAIDFLCSLIMIAVFAIPGLIIAAIIHFTSEGPVFYSEQRIGRGGRQFRIWKFRSMHRKAHQQIRVKAPGSGGGVVLEWRMHKHLDDPRVTRFGGFLRRWSLDELPQLFNVLRGEMSLVGPRPIVETETVLYEGLLSYYLAATPGLSGAWQVSGRSDVGYKERARLDASYVWSWSLKTDIMILFRTIPVVLSRVGAR